MELSISILSGDPLPMSVKAGEQIFIVGANGSGKSALVQHFITSCGISQFRRIAAHRQTWFHSGNLDFTARTRREFETNSNSWDSQTNARWIDHNPEQKQSAALFDLVSKDNTRYRIIGQHIDDQNLDEAVVFASKSVSIFKQLNDLLGLGTLTVSIKNSKDEEILAQHRDSDLSFSIAQMSDGERAAVIIAANVLTVEPGTVLLIDEPERHLHRSIIEPFLSALFTQREDCSFVVSTHEIALPMANPEARVLLLRSCSWQGEQAQAWDAEVLESGADLPEDLKRDVLGARRRILFVEGESSSLDLPLYGGMFPELSVIPKGSCEEVIRAVKGLSGSYEHHHVEAIGLIDKDDRTQVEVNELAQDNVFALEVCSAESLYYCSDAIEAVACRQAESLGRNPKAMLKAAKQNALEAIGADQDLPKRMAARRSERMVYNRFMTQLPNWKEIKATGGQLTINKPIENPFQDELDRFNNLNESGDLDSLIARYPLKESSVFESIAKALECGKRGNYARMVVARVRDDRNFARKLKKRISPLAELLDGELDS